MAELPLSERDTGADGPPHRAENRWRGLAPGLVNAALLVGLAAWAVGAAALGEGWFVSLASRIAILALAATGLNLALGLGGMVSLGHAAFFGIGGYVAGIAANAAMTGAPVTTWPVTLAGSDQMPAIWLAAMAIAALAALAIGAVSLRTTGIHFIMITLAFAQMVYYFAISWPAYGGPRSRGVMATAQRSSTMRMFTKPRLFGFWPSAVFLIRAYFTTCNSQLKMAWSSGRGCPAASVTGSRSP